MHVSARVAKQVRLANLLYMAAARKALKEGEAADMWNEYVRRHTNQVLITELISSPKQDALCDANAEVPGDLQSLTMVLNSQAREIAGKPFVDLLASISQECPSFVVGVIITRETTAVPAAEEPGFQLTTNDRAMLERIQQQVVMKTATPKP